MISDLGQLKLFVGLVSFRRESVRQKNLSAATEGAVGWLQKRAKSGSLLISFDRFNCESLGGGTIHCLGYDPLLSS